MKKVKLEQNTAKVITGNSNNWSFRRKLITKYRTKVVDCAVRNVSKSQKHKKGKTKLKINLNTTCYVYILFSISYVP